MFYSLLLTLFCCYMLEILCPENIAMISSLLLTFVIDQASVLCSLARDQDSLPGGFGVEQK